MSSQVRSHSRQNLLTGEWVLVSPHRTERPWRGQLEASDAVDDPSYDPDCYLCPGNERANGKRNPDYHGAFAFDNDYPALSGAAETEILPAGLFASRPESGCCRVLCYSEQHKLRMSTMSVDLIARAIGAMAEEFRRLDRQASIGYVQIFENRGLIMGCSNQHPHAQIWATENVPNEPLKELATQSAWYETNDAQLLLDYLQAEMQDGARRVCENACFGAVVPYWAIWPFETLVIPRRKFSAPDEMEPKEILGLAAMLKSVLAAYDRLFDVAAPYSLGYHPRPSDGRAHPEWIFHAHIYPPLLRSARIRKHMVGFEMLGMPQRDLTAEVAAEKLRHALSELGKEAS